MEISQLKSIIESLLFVSGEPISLSRLIKITRSTKEEVQNALMILKADYGDERGLRLVEKEDKIQLATNPNNAEFVSELIKSEVQENLSRSGLEVLAIVAYRGPISRINIEAIRGVNSSFTLRALLMRGLIERVDNPQDNRGYLYKISFDFLHKLGLDRVESLPDWENLKKDSRIDNVIEPEESKLLTE